MDTVITRTGTTDHIDTMVMALRTTGTTTVIEYTVITAIIITTTIELT